MSRYITGLAAVLCAVSVSSGLAQNAGAAGAQAPSAPSFVNLARVSADYQVGAGDLLEVQVIGQADLSQSLRIAGSGEISFPMVGLIQIAGHSTFEVEDAIAERLRAAGLVQEPEVLVTVREYQAKPIYISGAVVSPGEFVMSQELTVSDAVLLAGGLAFNAADEALLHRRVSPAAAAAATGAAAPGPGVETITVDLRPLKDGRFFDGAVSLQRGDVVYVPEQRMQPFFVAGEVIEPRNYFYAPGKVVTASQAISHAGGPLPTAKLSNGMLVRFDDKGGRVELKVDYKAILEGRQKDFPIEPYDIIFIPGSKIRTITHGLMGMTDGMVGSTALRIARTYQLPDPPAREERRDDR